MAGQADLRRGGGDPMTAQVRTVFAAAVLNAEPRSQRTRPELLPGKMITLEAFLRGDSWKVDLNGC